MASAHVVPNSTRWDAKGDGSLISSEQTQAQAIDVARKWLQRNGGGELSIHGLDGKVRQKDTVYPGNDPRNIRG